jgi:hypothetical protein
VIISGPANVRVGEEFEVMIDVTIPAPLQTLSMAIRFDPKVLTFIEARPEELARKSGIDGALHKLESLNGHLNVELHALGNPLFGQGRLLNLRFSANTARAQTAIALGQANVPGNVSARTTPQNTLRLRVGS